MPTRRSGHFCASKSTSIELRVEPDPRFFGSLLGPSFVDSGTSGAAEAAGADCIVFPIRCCSCSACSERSSLRCGLSPGLGLGCTGYLPRRTGCTRATATGIVGGSATSRAHTPSEAADGAMKEFVGDRAGERCVDECEIELVDEWKWVPSARNLDVLLLRGSSCPTSAACDRRWL